MHQDSHCANQQSLFFLDILFQAINYYLESPTFYLKMESKRGGDNFDLGFDNIEDSFDRIPSEKPLPFASVFSHFNLCDIVQYT